MSIFRKKKYSTIRPVSIKKKDIPKGIWDKCKSCNEVIYQDKLKENLNICPKCSFHNPMTADERINLLTDEGTFKEVDKSIESVDTLKFEGISYSDKLEANKKKTGMKDAVVCGTATLDKKPLALAVMDFRFLGASMGSVVGEKITRITELATKKRLPLVIVTASGGARMYEGMLSLMQMAKTSGALERHMEAGLPYIVIMTHPTTAGVTASFASLGDLTIAEPKALIGFAGPRVIKDTTQAELPEGFQSSEFLLKKGMIDRIVDRRELRAELSLYLDFFKASCGKKSG
jgi:acetyl-CoA carboxylase carboxyl transferase subunit beta